MGKPSDFSPAPPSCSPGALEQDGEDGGGRGVAAGAPPQVSEGDQASQEVLRTSPGAPPSVLPRSLHCCAHRSDPCSECSPKNSFNLGNSETGFAHDWCLHPSSRASRATLASHPQPARARPSPGSADRPLAPRCLSGFSFTPFLHPPQPPQTKHAHLSGTREPRHRRRRTTRRTSATRVTTCVSPTRGRCRR